MIKMIIKLLLAGDKLMPELHLRQTGFTCSVCGPFTKNKERIQNFKETGYSKHIYQTEIDKACFQHDVWLVGILRICLEEELLIKYYLINHLLITIKSEI